MTVFTDISDPELLYSHCYHVNFCMCVILLLWGSLVNRFTIIYPQCIGKYVGGVHNAGLKLTMHNSLSIEIACK